MKQVRSMSHSFEESIRNPMKAPLSSTTNRRPIEQNAQDQEQQVLFSLSTLSKSRLMRLEKPIINAVSDPQIIIEKQESSQMIDSLSIERKNNLMLKDNECAYHQYQTYLAIRSSQLGSVALRSQHRGQPQLSQTLHWL